MFFLITLRKIFLSLEKQGKKVYFVVKREISEEPRQETLILLLKWDTKKFAFTLWTNDILAVEVNCVRWAKAHHRFYQTSKLSSHSPKLSICLGHEMPLREGLKSSTWSPNPVGRQKFSVRCVLTLIASGGLSICSLLKHLEFLRQRWTSWNFLDNLTSLSSDN